MNDGTLEMNSSTLNAPLVNTGALLVRGSSRINGTFETGRASSIVIRGDGNVGSSTLTVADGFENRGTIELTSRDGGYGTTLAVTKGTLVNAAGARIETLVGAGGPRTVTASLENRGDVIVRQDTTIGGTSTVFTNAGTVKVAAASTLTLGGAVTGLSGGVFGGGRYELGGTLRLPTGAVTLIGADVVLDGAGGGLLGSSGQNLLPGLTGTVKGGALRLANGRDFATTRDWSNAGTLDLGADSLFSAANFRQAGSGWLVVALPIGSGDTQRAAPIAVAGRAALGGRLAIVPFGQALPALGDSFALLSASATDGGFRVPGGGLVGPGVRLVPVASATGVRLGTLNPADNHMPVATADVFTVVEDTSLVFDPAGNDADADGDLPYVIGFSRPARGDLRFDDEGLLVYTPAANASGTETFEYRSTDGLLETGARVTLEILPVNDAPTGQDRPLVLQEDAQHVFSPEDFGYADLEGDAFVAVRFPALPAAGALTLRGVALTAGAEVSVEDIKVGALVFRPAPDANGAGYARIDFQVRDAGGTALGGKDTDPTPNLFIVDVVSVADVPRVTLAPALTVEEDTALSFAQTGRIALVDPDGDVGEVSLSVQHGTLTLQLGGTATVAEGALGTASVTLRGSQVDLSRTLLTLGYRGSADFFGSDTLRVVAVDAGGLVGAAETALTVKPVNDAPVAVADGSYTIDTGLVLTVSAADGVLGNDIDVDGPSLTAQLWRAPRHGTVTLAADGSFRYQSVGGYGGSDVFEYRVLDGITGGNVVQVAIDVRPAYLEVDRIRATESGVDVRFSRALDASRLNLYDSADARLGSADLTVVGDRTGSITGSLVLHEDGMGVSFVKTGGPLLADTYKVTVRGGTGGFADVYRRALDGNRDGVIGDDATASFTVAPSKATVVSIPDFMRGPGQPVAVPNRAAGSLPLRLSEGAGVQSLSVELQFDNGLFSIRDVRLAGGIAGTVSTTAIHGGMRIQVALGAPLGRGAVDLLDIFATVPAGASTNVQQVIDLRNVVIRDGRGLTLPVIADDAVQAVGYLGDTNADQRYTRADYDLLQRVILRTDSGFAAWRNTDPLLVGDINANGQVTQLDAARLLQQASGSLRPEIPAIPDPVAAPVAASQTASLLPLAAAAPALPPAPLPSEIASVAAPVSELVPTAGSALEAAVPGIVLPAITLAPSVSLVSDAGEGPAGWRSTAAARDLSQLDVAGSLQQASGSLRPEIPAIPGPVTAPLAAPQTTSLLPLAVAVPALPPAPAQAEHAMVAAPVSELAATAGSTLEVAVSRIALPAITPAPSVSPVPAAGVGAADWRSTAWALDLSQRLKGLEAPAPADEPLLKDTGPLKSLLRAITRR
ncbi:MAG: Ig-like domain-containing protein [Betaproteobacteria bacterium]